MAAISLFGGTNMAAVMSCEIQELSTRSVISHNFERANDAGNTIR